VDVFAEAYIAELERFVAALRGEVPPDATADDARAALILALAAIRSVENGRPVRTGEIHA
jgi:myo-inositol 2-dehydrogenase/D-chiro-inositol 1-dehydrogenase